MDLISLLVIFMVGAVGGWILELFYRRFVSLKKWINPGFLNGPYLPMYGCGAVMLYCACFIPVPKWCLVLILAVLLTLLEYITGLIFIKGLKIKLWDYSNQFGNVQGIICPLYSFFWTVVAALFVYLLYEPLYVMASWSSDKTWMIFLLGAFYGVFIVDICVSFNVSLKIRKAAKRLKEIVHYEELKAAINERRQKNMVRRRFLFSFSGVSLRDSVREWYEKKKGNGFFFKKKKVVATDGGAFAETEKSNDTDTAKTPTADGEKRSD